MTDFEKENQKKSALDKSAAAASAIARENVYDEEDDGSVFEEDTALVDTPTVAATGSSRDLGSSPEDSKMSSHLIPIINSIFSNPTTITLRGEELIRAAQSTPIEVIDEYFKAELFDKQPAIVGEARGLILIKIASILFPVSFQRHSIVVPILKLLETIAWTERATISHLVLLFEYLIEGSKFSPSCFYLAGRLWRQESSDKQQDIVILVSEYCSKFTRESLYGVIEEFFPELLEMMGSSDEVFTPMKLHTFKPVEVLSLEPAFHEEGEQWNGNHKEMREAKKLQQQYKKDKRLTAKEMRREAGATEAFAAVQKQKEKQKLELERKRTVTKMHEAEANYHFTRTDNGKPPSQPLKNRKKVRLGGNKQ
jgi:hypothetical protein